MGWYSCGPVQPNAWAIIVFQGAHPVMARAHLRSEVIDTQEELPGIRHSQKFQPLTEFFVMSTAAADGESYRFSATTKAPASTRPAYSLPLYFARNSVPAGKRTPF